MGIKVVEDIKVATDGKVERLFWIIWVGLI